MILGAVLLAAALSLFLYNQHEATQAKQASDKLMPLLAEQIKENVAKETQSSTPSTLPQVLPEAIQNTESTEMDVSTVDGYDYIGFLTIPKFELELPVMSDWSYPQLRIAPCRYVGSVRSGDLVIMAHNYARHFGLLEDLTVGDDITFTDMRGNATVYQVVGLDVLPPTAVKEMTSGEYDLTLFTCTFGGRSRVTVYCDKMK